ncbi:MAG: GH92 family glycosyl hydrolase, partial [Cyclobacteriaceae bacterium]|nr:GH92 family glycosyl hydrolase [Cyclobacteriaceae bacterium HetDA_MAG_MS6]
MIGRLVWTTLALFLFAGFNTPENRRRNGNLISYVNPFIGTSGGGNTHPGAIVPWGMASSSPYTIYGPYGENESFNKIGAVAYYHEKKFLTGFTHANMSGVGCPDLGSAVLMPTAGALDIDPKKYGSNISKETASPGYYATTLDKYHIKSEVTATERTIRHRHHFPEGQANFILNLGLGVSDEPGGMINIVSETEIEGFEMYGQFCFEKHYNGRVFFVVQFSEPAFEYGSWHNKYKQHGYHKSAIGDNIGAFYSFQAKKDKPIEVRVGISYVSIANARHNLQVEQSNRSFDQLKEEAEEKWEKELSRVKVEGGDFQKKKSFYTALYHTLLHPNIFSDANGQYVAMDGSIRKTTEAPRYSTFSLWDTYRNIHPFLSLVYPEKQKEMVRTILDMYHEQGWLPKWELAGKETLVMVGDPAAIVINDTYARGIQDFDVKAALEAMLKSGCDTTQKNLIRPGLKHYLESGYIPHEHSGPTPAIKPIPWGSVSTTLEYSLADWNIAQFAYAQGKNDIGSDFTKRSANYKQLYHKPSGFLLPRYRNGKWHTSEKQLGSQEIGFVEGNAWNYNFFVPQDINGMKQLMGEGTMLRKLQQCFKENHFVLWNEPDMAYPYLFNYFPGEEWRTTQEVHRAVSKHFKTTPDGLPG